jgi:hypothetical protein
MVLRYEDVCDGSTYAYRACPVNSAVRLATPAPTVDGAMHGQVF